MTVPPPGHRLGSTKQPEGRFAVAGIRRVSSQRLEPSRYCDGSQHLPIPVTLATLGIGRVARIDSWHIRC